MRKHNINPLKIIIIVCLLTVFSVGYVQAANDTLLEMLPEDCLFCVRINDLNTSLGKIDTYLKGTSSLPFSLEMFVNSQLAGFLGDPMMTGIDMEGNFAAVGLSDMTVGLLVPVTDYAEFVKTNPNCTEEDSGIAILFSENAPMSMAMLPAAGGKYAIVMPEYEQAKLAPLKASLDTNSPLSSRLSAEQTKEALSAPVWAYINTAALYQQFSPLVLSQLDQLPQNMPDEIGEMKSFLGFYINIYTELFKTFAGDADSITLALTPDTANLSLDVSMKAKDGSETAQMLVADPTAEQGYTLTGYLDDGYAVNGLMKVNQPSLKMVYDKLFDIMDKVSADQGIDETMEKMKSLTLKNLDTMGTEAAFSFSYAGGQPPFKINEVIAVNNINSIREMLTESMDMVSDFYAELGLPMEFKYQPSVSTYKGATFDQIIITISQSDNADNPMEQTMEQLYGGQLSYMLAFDNDKYYLAMGENSEIELKKLIDQNASSPATGEVKAAIDLLQKDGYNDFVCSINIIKLISGVADMMGSLSQIEGSDLQSFPATMLSEINVPTESSLAMGGKVANGQVSLRTVLPKKHLFEVMEAVMQIREKAMEQIQIQMDAMP